MVIVNTFRLSFSKADVFLAVLYYWVLKKTCKPHIIDLLKLKKQTNYSIQDEDDSDSEEVVICSAPLQDIKNGKFCLIYAYPETLVEKDFGKILRSKLYQERVCAVVVDEVHIVSEW